MPNWQELLSKEGPGVWRTVYRILDHRADAEECYQDTFLAALEVSHREVVRSWPALLRRLATARAVERLRQRCRRRAREKALDWDDVPCPMQPPSQTAEERELAQRLREALARIPPQQAEVFCLHCLEGWSYQEIAEQCELSQGAVGVILHRARKQLQSQLATFYGSSRKEIR